MGVFDIDAYRQFSIHMNLLIFQISHEKHVGHSIRYYSTVAPDCRRRLAITFWLARNRRQMRLAG